jgi:hypothetical protein
MKKPSSFSTTLCFSPREPMESKRASPGWEPEQHPIGLMQVGLGGQKHRSSKGPIDREPNGFDSSNREMQKNNGKALLASNNHNVSIKVELEEICI